MITPLFNCSQADLIIVLGTALDSYLQYVADFTAFSPPYTVAWGTDRQEQLADAAAMPDEDTSRAISEGIRNDLGKFCKDGRFDWQSMKRYITRSYAEDMWGFKIKAAGGNFYLNASNENWPQAQQMFTNALNFIEANEAALLPVMPATFKASFTATVATFKQGLKDYEQSKEAITENTQNRLKALNAIYEVVMAMMKDGQLIFREDDAVRKQFVFTEILGRVSGAGLAGLRGTITDSFANTPLASVTITVKDGNGVTIDTGTTDAQGNYVINTPSGQYSVTFELAGYISRIIENFTVDVGTVSRLDVALSPVVPEEEG